MDIENNKKLRMLIVDKFGTQERFAATIGIAETVVSKLVRGIRTPTPAEKQLISTALDVKEEDLFS